jgi:hypothetical protein
MGTNTIFLALVQADKVSPSRAGDFGINLDWHIDAFNDTYTHMKTTIEISDALLEAARKVSRREKTTVRSLVEEGLRRVIAEREGSRKFRLRKATFKGNGLQPQVAGASWDRIRDLIYEGRGA